MRQADAATLFGPEDLRLVAAALPPLPAGMVRIRFAAGGICGSDLHYFRHARTGDFIVTSPLVLGHEMAGVVDEVGEGVHGLAPGAKVAVNPSRWCGHCPRCREGRANLCENIYFMGSASKTPHMQGGFASLFDVTPPQCVPVPDDAPLAAVALAEPLAVCLHAVARAGELAGRHALLIGAGPIGLLTMLAARRAGVGRVTVADISAAPLAYAAKLGADATADLSAGSAALDAASVGHPFDVVFEISGAPAGLATALRSVRRGGTVVQLGNLPGGAIEAPVNLVMSKEIELRGSFRFDREFAEAVGLIVAGEVDVRAIVTGEMPLSAAPDAFRLALDRSRSLKVMLTAG